MTKRQIYIPVSKSNLDDCTVEEMINKLTELKITHKEHDLFLEYVAEDTYSGPSQIVIYYNREESDEEYKSRLDFENEFHKDMEIREMNRLLKCKKLNPTNQLKLDEYLIKYKNEK